MARILNGTVSMKRNMKFILGGMAILILTGYLLYSGLGETAVYYYTIDEVYRAGPELENKGIRISGQVMPGTIRYDSASMNLGFVIRDIESSPATMTVSYKGLRPDALNDETHVIVEGRYRGDDRFQASSLLTKCPSKYESKKAERVTQKVE
jgi:cytochrome c-type biogenesis protein CcmE